MKYAPYSASRLSIYDKCPRKFKYIYIDNVDIPFEETEALIRGSMTHLFLEHHGKDLAFVVNEMKKDSSIKNSQFFTKEVIKKSYKIYKDFLKMPLGIEIFNRVPVVMELPLGLDKKLHTSKYDSKDTLFRGYIDAVFRSEDGKTVWITDWKTGKDRSEGRYAQPFDQLLHYASWYFETFPVDNIIIEYVFVEHGTSRTFKLVKEDLNKYKKALVNDIIRVEKDTGFKKNPSVLCDYCNYKEHCDNDFT